MSELIKLPLKMVIRQFKFFRGKKVFFIYDADKTTVIRPIVSKWNVNDGSRMIGGHCIVKSHQHFLDFCSFVRIAVSLYIGNNRIVNRGDEKLSSTTAIG